LIDYKASEDVADSNLYQRTFYPALLKERKSVGRALEVRVAMTPVDVSLVAPV
jgi:hypothetical protein